MSVPDITQLSSWQLCHEGADLKPAERTKQATIMATMCLKCAPAYNAAFFPARGGKTKRGARAEGASTPQGHTHRHPDSVHRKCTGA